MTVGDTRAEVLSVKQGLDPRPGAETLGRYKDGSAALVKGTAGKGTVYCAGFLPALAYIKAAQVARVGAGDQDRDRVARSANPWAFPAGVRGLLLRPVRSAGVAPPVTCSVPVVDAVYMTCDRGVVVPLANYTLRPVGELTLTVRVDRPVARAGVGPPRPAPVPVGGRVRDRHSAAGGDRLREAVLRRPGREVTGPGPSPAGRTTAACGADRTRLGHTRGVPMPIRPRAAALLACVGHTADWPPGAEYAVPGDYRATALKPGGWVTATCGRSS